MRIVWNQNALDSLDKNINHLKKNWSTDVLVNFLDIVDEKVELLKTYPEMGIICEFKPILRQLVITKHITLFYEVETDEIYLHLFWLNFSDSLVLQMLLS